MTVRNSTTMTSTSANTPARMFPKAQVGRRTLPTAIERSGPLLWLLSLAGLETKQELSDSTRSA